MDEPTKPHGHGIDLVFEFSALINYTGYMILSAMTVSLFSSLATQLIVEVTSEGIVDFPRKHTDEYLAKRRILS